MAICRAQAYVQQQEVYECIAELIGSESVSLPFPLVNVLMADFILLIIFLFRKLCWSL